MATNGSVLPSADTAGSLVSQHRPQRHLNIWAALWTEHLQRDLAQLSALRLPSGRRLDCCTESHPACLPLHVDDQCVGLVRALPAPELDCVMRPAAPLSAASSYLDLETLYGSSEEDGRQLRTLSGGRLRADSDSDSDSARAAFSDPSMSGPLGPQATAAYSGAPLTVRGEPGEKGMKGQKGKKGEKGMTGPPGPPATCSVGEKGEKGEKGMEGMPGPPSLQNTGAFNGTNITGPFGAKATAFDGAGVLYGEKGEKGMKGRRGMKGEKGMTGAPGPPGTVMSSDPTNLKGEKGTKGMTGMPGPPGPQVNGTSSGPNMTGPTGPQAAAAYSGPQILRGEPGEKGMKGQKGRKGQKGMTGPPGASVTVTCDLGEKGEKGEKGMEGIPGPPGPPANAMSTSPNMTRPLGPPVSAAFSGPPRDTVTRGFPGPLGPRGEEGPARNSFGKMFAARSMGAPGEPGLNSQNVPMPAASASDRLLQLLQKEHNRVAAAIQRNHRLWEDERVFQEARRMVVAQWQHITFHEYLPHVLGVAAAAETVTGAADKTLADPTVTVEFAAAAFRFWQHKESPQELDAVNVLRGRELGLPTYATVRHLCTGLRVTAWSELEDVMDRPAIERLQATYSSPGDVDLWVGGMLERHAPSAKVGPTFLCVIADQFRRLRDGDRFFYERSLSTAQLQEVRKTSLARLLCDHEGRLVAAPLALEPLGRQNQMTACSSEAIPRPDLSVF